MACWWIVRPDDPGPRGLSPAHNAHAPVAIAATEKGEQFPPHLDRIDGQCRRTHYNFLYSEDFQHGQRIQSVTIENPFGT